MHPKSSTSVSNSSFLCNCVWSAFGAPHTDGLHVTDWSVKIVDWSFINDNSSYYKCSRLKSCNPAMLLNQTNLLT